MRAMYRIWGREGHRQKASWQASTTFNTVNGYTIKTWCFDKTKSHDYVDIEILCNRSVRASNLYDELDAQLSDGIFECNHGKVEKLKYSYYWTSECPSSKGFNKEVAEFEELLNNYAIQKQYIIVDNALYTPFFCGNRFTMIRGVEYK